MTYFSPTKSAVAYAVRILLGCMIVWFTMNQFDQTKKIWALISVIVVLEPDLNAIRVSLVSRIVNTLSGCIVALLFIYFAGIHSWSVLAAITTSVIVSTSFRNYPTSWKLAPVTVLVIMLSVGEHAKIKDAFNIALSRSAEVLYGSLVAFILGWIFSLIFKKKLVEAAPEIYPDPSEGKWKAGHE